jgi:hypothetical protein
MTDVKKRRIISVEELGVPRWEYKCKIASICFSQDEEYLIICLLSNAVMDRSNMVLENILGHSVNLMNDVLIIQIGSLSDFFSGSPINVKAVLQLKNMNITFI